MACACGKEDCKCSSNDLVPDKMAYQVNKRRNGMGFNYSYGYYHYPDFGIPKQTRRGRKHTYDTVYFNVWTGWSILRF